MNNKVYQIVADKIIEQIDKGVCPWRMPWLTVGGACVNYVTRKPYSLLNCMLLGETGEYLSMKQIDALHGSVVKGTKARICVFFKMHEIIDPNEDKPKRFPVLRFYNVFHIKDVIGVDSKMPPSTIEVKDQDECYEQADDALCQYIIRTGIDFQEGSFTEAYFSPSADAIRVPCKKQYPNIAEYYSTTFHECIHSTGAEGRLNRLKVSNNRYDNVAYGEEELTAEVGSALLMNHFGIDDKDAFMNSAAYLKSWRDKIKQDNKAIVYAAIRAEKAANYFLGITPSTNLD